MLSVAQALVNPAWIITNDVGPVGLSAGDTVSDGGTHSGATYLLDAFATIQEGIDNVDAGGEVVILPGIYSGTININKAVKLTALAGADTSAVTIQLNGGADLSGSSGIAASAVNVHVGAHVSDGVLLTKAGGVLTIDAGSYGDDVTLAKSIKLLSSGGAVSVGSFTLNSGAALLSGSSGVSSTSISVNAGAKLADAVSLASSVAQTTITAGASSYSETVTIGKSIKFVGTATVTAFILASGSSIAAGSGVTSTTITMISGAKLQDAINLASNSAQTAIALPTGANTFAETVTITKNVKLTATSTSTIAALVLGSGESVAISGTIRSTSITVNNGAKLADALLLASASALTTISVEAGTYAETVTIGKSIKWFCSGAASVNAFVLNGGEAIDPSSSGVSSTSVTVAATARVQDAIYLASPTATTTLILKTSNYAETVTIDRAVQFGGTPATLDGVILNSGAAIAAGSTVSSLAITVNNGAKVSDALALATLTVGLQSVITVAAGIYNNDATIAASIKFISDGASVHSFTLAAGAVIDAASAGVFSQTVIVDGGKVRDALRLAATGTAAAPSDVILSAAAYAESVQMPAKFLRFSSTAGGSTLTAITLAEGTSIDAASSGVSAPVVTVNLGARVQDGVNLIQAGGSSLLKLQSGTYPDSVTIGKAMQFRTLSGTASLAGITLGAGATLTGSVNVSSTDIHVSGGTLADALLLAAPSNATTTTVTLNSGNYNESLTIAGQRIKFAAVGGIAAITGAAGVTLDTGAIIDPASADVFANTVTINQINGTVKVQDGILLAGNGGTLKLKAGSYAESVTIGAAMRLATISGTATLAGIVLNGGASLAGSANVTSANITVNGALVDDAILLAATGTLASPTIVTLTGAAYAETVTLGAKFLKLSSAAGSTIGALVLGSGVSIDAASSGVTSTNITLGAGVKLQTALSLASSSAQTTITVGAASYAENLVVTTDVRFAGTATATSITVGAGGNVASPGGVTSSDVTVNNGGQLQGGINALAAGATLSVGAGRYAGDLTIDKSLTMSGPQVGMDGTRNVLAGSEAIIAGVVTITPGAGDVIIDGFTIDRAAHGNLVISDASGVTTLRNNIVNGDYAAGSGNTAAVIFDGGTSAVLSHNQISTNAAAATAVAFGPIESAVTVASNDVAGLVDLSGLDGADVMVTGNAIHNASGDGIALGNGTVHNVTISGNSLTNNQGIGLNVDGAGLTVTGASFAISLNIFSGNGTGVRLANLARVGLGDNQFAGCATAILLENASDLTVGENALSGNGVGIDISGSGTHDVAISNNFILNNHDAAGTAGFGIHITSGAITGAGVQVAGNSITGNFVGLANESAQTIDAALNWWGSANGPTALDNTSEVLPHGDAVVGNVHFAPWQASGVDGSAADGFQASGPAFAPISNNSGASFSSIQEALDGTAANGTITIAAGAYAEDLFINKAITLQSAGAVLVNSITLSADAVLGASSGGVSSILVAVQNGATAQDGVRLAAAGATLALQSGGGFEDQDLKLDKSLTLVHSGAGDVALKSITLENGAMVGAASSGVSSLIVYVNGGARLADGILLAADGATITLGAGTFAGDVVIDKSLTIDGNQAGNDARLRTGLGDDESHVAGAIVVTSAAGEVIIDGLAIDDAKPDGLVISHAAGKFTFRNNVVNANYLAAQYDVPSISVDNAVDVVILHNKIIAALDIAAGNLALGFAPANGFLGVSGTISLADNDISGSISLAGLAGANVTMTGNLVHGGSADGVVLADGAVQDVSFSGNTFSDNTLAGVRIEGLNLVVAGSIEIAQNQIAANQTGLALSGALSGIAIHNNFVTDNLADGISIDSTAAGIGAIHENYISGNGIAGLRSDSAEPIDVTANYWGRDDGPATPLNNWSGGPKGDAVIGSNLLVAPWYSDGMDADPAAPGYQPGVLDDSIPDVSVPDLTSASDTGYRADDNITSDTTPTFSGSADAGSSVVLMEGTMVLGSALADDGGNWSITALPLGDGAHDIIARATKLSGNSRTSLALTIFIDTTAPVVDAGGDRSIDENGSVTLSGAFADSGGTGPVIRSWHFVSSSNGQIVSDAAGDSISFTGLDNGTFTFEYNVTDAAGNLASDLATVVVRNVAPTIGIDLSTTTIDENGSVAITGDITDPGTLDIHTVSIDWGDGGALQVLNLPAGVTSIPPTSHTYLDNRAADAAYTILVSVSDGDDGALVSKSVGVKNVAPVVSIDGLPNASVPSGTAIQLTASASDPGTLDTLTYLWVVTKTKDNVTTAFASRTTADVLARSDSFTFTPDVGANYDVALTVIDKDGAVVTASGSVVVVDIEPTVMLSGSKENAGNSAANVAEGSLFTLTIGALVDPAHPGGDSTAEYHIHWGDDSDETVLSETELNAANRQVTHIYADGTAAANSSSPMNMISVDLLTLGGTQYHTDAGSLGVVVFDLPPTAGFAGSAAVNEGSAGTVLFFNQSDISAADTAAGFTYSFDFNNDGIFEMTGAASPGVTVPASYLADGPFDRVVAGRIYDRDGFFTQYTRTIQVKNVAPVLNLGGGAAAEAGELFTRAGFFADPGADAWTGTVDYGDGAGAQPLVVGAGKGFALAHVYAAAGTYTVSVQIADDDLADTSNFDVTVAPSALRVVQFTPTASGVDIRFNRAIDLSVLNLYDVDSAVSPDLTLAGAGGGTVRGSAVWDAATNTLHFIKTGGVLAADRYTLNLAGRTGGFVDLGGRVLDGDGDGDDGGDYTAAFTVDAPGVVVSVPDFARGAGQHVDVAADGTASASGLSVSISDGANVRSVDFDLRYDPALLHISGVSLAEEMPADTWAVTFNNATAGVLHVSLSGSSALPAGPIELLKIAADVPVDAPYKASEAITFGNLRVNEGAIAAAGDAAVHKAVYFGDASGDGTVGSFDANRISRVVVGLDGTFASGGGGTVYPLTDPRIIADVSGDGTLSGLDAALVAQKFVDPAGVMQIPDVPAGGASITATVDPTISMPGALAGRPGGGVVVPVSISEGAGFLAGDLTIAYDSALLALGDADLVLSDYLAARGWTMSAHAAISSPGLLRIGLYSTGDALPSGQADLLDLNFLLNPAAANGQSSAIHVVVAPANSSRLNEGQLALSTSDGSIVVDAVRPTVASSQFVYDDGPARIAVEFSEDVSRSLSIDDFGLFDLTTNQAVAASHLSLLITGDSATLSFGPGGLADGRYRLAIKSTDVTDAGGNLLDGDGSGGDHVLDFFILTGDADHDGVVAFSDLVAVAQHYEKAGDGIHWSTGDFNQDGKVSFADLVAVAQHYGNTVLPPEPAPASVAPAAIVPAAGIVAPPVIAAALPSIAAQTAAAPAAVAPPPAPPALRKTAIVSAKPIIAVPPLPPAKPAAIVRSAAPAIVAAALPKKPAAAQIAARTPFAAGSASRTIHRPPQPLGALIQSKRKQEGDLIFL